MGGVGVVSRLPKAYDYVVGDVLAVEKIGSGLVVHLDGESAIPVRLFLSQRQCDQLLGYWRTAVSGPKDLATFDEVVDLIARQPGNAHRAGPRLRGRRPQSPS